MRDGGQPTPLTAAMPRTLLGILLCRANSPTSVDVLVDALWEGRPADTAHKKLQLHVHRLRRSLWAIRRGSVSRAPVMRCASTPTNSMPNASRPCSPRAPTAPTPGSRPVRCGCRARPSGSGCGDPFGDVANVPLLRAEADRLTERRLTARGVRRSFR